MIKEAITIEGLDFKEVEYAAKQILDKKDSWILIGKDIITNTINQRVLQIRLLRSRIVLIPTQQSQSAQEDSAQESEQTSSERENSQS